MLLHVPVATQSSGSYAIRYVPSRCLIYSTCRAVSSLVHFLVPQLDFEDNAEEDDDVASSAEESAFNEKDGVEDLYACRGPAQQCCRQYQV